MSVRNIIQAAAGSSGGLYPEDVFSTYLYDGDGSNYKRIQNNINLSGRNSIGGLNITEVATNGAPGAISQDPSGNIYSAFFLLTLQAVVVSKFNTIGNLVWQRQINDAGGTGDGSVFDLIVDPSGNSYVLFKRGSGSADRVSVTKLNTNGTVLWGLATAYISNVNNAKLTVDSSFSNFYVCVFDGSGATTKLLLYKVSSAGSVVWKKDIVNAVGIANPYMGVKSLQMTSDGYLTIFGYRTISAGVQNGVIIKISEAGALISNTALTLNSSSQFNISEAREVSNTTYMRAQTNTSVVLLNINSSNTVIWSKTISKSEFIYVYDSTNLYVTSNIINNKFGAYESIITKIDTGTGNILYSKIIADSNLKVSYMSSNTTSLAMAGTIYKSGSHFAISSVVNKTEFDAINNGLFGDFSYKANTIVTVSDYPTSLIYSPAPVTYTDSTATITNSTSDNALTLTNVYGDIGEIDTKQAGLVWLKGRSFSSIHAIFDTIRGTNKYLLTTATNAQATANTLTNFYSNGFSVSKASGQNINDSGQYHVSWTFKTAPKFFDIVTYTGTGVNRTVQHNLGSVPGFIIVKRTDSISNWPIYHSGITSANSFSLNSSGTISAQSTVWNSTEPTANNFTVGTSSETNANNGIYIAYLFANTAGGFGKYGNESIVSCGMTAGGPVNLGWEPQWILHKSTDFSQDWVIIDNMRGLPWGSTPNQLFPSTTGIETTTSTSGTPKLYATGFELGAILGNHIYVAIRKPMKIPILGTEVFSPIVANTTVGTKITTDFAVDMQLFALRTGTTNKGQIVDRLRGVSANTTESGRQLITNSTAAETTNSIPTRFWDNTGFAIPSTYSSIGMSFLNFKRAPGFMDVVCYTGTGTNIGRQHNLGVIPELIIAKSRSNVSEWVVYTSPTGTAKYLYLGSTQAIATAGSCWPNAPTDTQFFTGDGSAINNNQLNVTFVAYLFATLAGIQYINSYIGDGTTGRVINCGFSAGARFVMIKATSTTGSWWIFDSARGIVAAADPVLQLNSTAAEITSADAVDPSASGFIVNQEATCSLNATGVTYLVWAIA